MNPKRHNFLWALIGIGIFVIGTSIIDRLTMALNRPVPPPALITTIEWVSDPLASNNAFLAYQDAYGPMPIGLANVGGDTCVIYAPVPRGKDDTDRLAILGHEVLHCFSGQFHK